MVVLHTLVLMSMLYDVCTIVAAYALYKESISAGSWVFQIPFKLLLRLPNYIACGVYDFWRVRAGERLLGF